MSRLSINEVTTYRWTFDEDVVQFRRAGISAIGVWRQKLSDFGEEKGIELLAENSMAVSNLLWAGGFTGSDGHTYGESLKDAADAIRLAAAMQAGCLVIYSGGRNHHTQNHARRLFAGALTELLPLAADLDVVLAVEPMHAGCAAEWTYLTTLDETLMLLDALAHPNLKLVFDTYHLGHDERILDVIPKLKDRIAIVHLADSQKPPQIEQCRQRLGEGILPLREIVNALRDTGYDGDFDVELIGEEIEATDYHALLSSSKEAYIALTGSSSMVRG